MKSRHNNSAAQILNIKRMCGRMLCTAFFLLSLVSCSNDTLWGIPIENIKQQLAAGDYSVFSSIPQTEYKHIAQLEPCAPFFVGRYLLDIGETDTARTILDVGAKKCPPPYNRMCLFLLIQNSVPTDVITYAAQYDKKWKDDTYVKAALADAYAEMGKYREVLHITETLDKNATNETDITDEESVLVGCAVYAQTMLDGTTVSTETRQWATHYFERFPVTEQYKRAATALSSPIAQARILTNEKYYNQAADIFTTLFTEQPGIHYDNAVLSDAGKAFLYSPTKANTREELWQQLPDCYMTLFYRGRFSEKRGVHKEAAVLFESALQNADKDERREHALWYLLKETAEYNLSLVPNLFARYQNNVIRPSYFADFFEPYLTKAVRENKWNDIADLYYRCMPAIDCDTAARIAFLTAYGLENNLVTVLPEDSRRFAQRDDELLRKQLIADAYTGVYLDTHATFYYRMKAGEQLGQSAETAALFKYAVAKKQEAKKPDNASGMPESLLTAEERIRGYLDYGLKNRAYQEILKNGDSIATDTLLGYSQEYRDRYNDYQKSVRIAVYALSSPDRPVTKDDMCAAYPLYYKDEINAACYLYQLEPALLCGLVRTESYFNHKVVSSAGAIGLTQLMTPTAADIARKLKKTNYDLTDPVTNITFGAFYLAELLRRLNGDVQDAVFSYNGGINRVRSWHKTIKAPDDIIFLEAVPIEETRDYGRKVLAATAVYRYLYDIE